MAEKRGRPANTMAPGERKSISFRVTFDVYERLVADAARTGRSISECAEQALQAHFAEDRMRVIAREEMDRREAERHAGTMAMLQRQRAVVGEVLQNPVGAVMRQRYELNGKQ